jgi:excinuclease UvrABC ATPase subunit
MAVRHFVCEHCESHGKILVKTNDVTPEDIVYCPVCGGDIFEDDEDYEE